MKRTTPELEPPSPNFCTTPAGVRLVPYAWFNVQRAHIHGGFSVESGFEPGTLRPRSRDFSITPERHLLGVLHMEKSALRRTRQTIGPKAATFGWRLLLG
ncbi:hypothetical protein AVEN_229130-1 [Araneus ventricosus]|uniref:Uncharacterized protein n=1 Tax=Araneus ventricosus TaxID=182803 RepID=A0A4Y2QNI5_ARAVE|nr:hypothetical protein AVEN_229130-1 [Araneus ventricosus]